MKNVPNSLKEQKSSKVRWEIISALIAIFIAGLIIGLFFKSGGVEGPIDTTILTETTEGKILFWTCSMHPQIKQAEPGRCPICGMDLVPMREEAGGGEEASLRLGERARHLASVQTTPVEYRKLAKSIYTVGKINYDESRIAHVTAWVSGRTDKLYVNFTGTIVKKGEHLVYMYSPDLLSTQEEYLLAYSGIEQLKQSPVPEIISSSRTLLENTKQRLLLWGITEEQINELEKTKKPQTHLTIHAPIGGTIINKYAFEGMYYKTGDMLFTIADLSRVWLYLDIYEYDIPWIRYGQDIEVITESYPGEVFHGTVVFIDPFLNEMTRTVKVRVNMDNREGKLKPGMYVNARFKVKLGSEGVI
ncbi:MAG: efflux RND transporter periplasmic adaptor subunit, partial [Candidatus Scalinduaceae bacterium]